MKTYEIEELINEQQTIILDREAKLRSKDYVGTKIAMGVATVEDYEDVISQTQIWRADINAAQAEIERQRAITPEEDTPEQ